MYQYDRLLLFHVNAVPDVNAEKSSMKSITECYFLIRVHVLSAVIVTL